MPNCSAMALTSLQSLPIDDISLWLSLDATDGPACIAVWYTNLLNGIGNVAFVVDIKGTFWIEI